MLSQIAPSAGGIGSRLEVLSESFGPIGIAAVFMVGICGAVYVMMRGAGVPLLLLLVSYSLVFVQQGAVSTFAFFIRVSSLLLLVLAAVRQLQRPSWHFWALFLYGVLGVVFAFASRHVEMAMQKGGLLLVTIVGASLGVASYVNSHKSVLTFYRMFVVAGVVWCVVSLVFLREFTSGRSLRFAGGGDVNATGYALSGALLLPFMLWATLRGWNPLWRALGVFGVFTIPLCLFLSGTRTAMVVGVATCAPILLRGSMLKSIGIWVVVAMLGIGALMFGRSMLQGRDTSFISRRLTTLTLSGRESRWAFAFKACLSNPVFGHGAGGAESLRQESAAGVNFHNAYLSIWYNTGIMGLVCVVSVLVSQGLRAMYLMRRAPDPFARDAMRVAFGMLLALGAVGLVENSLSSPSNAVIAMFVMMVSLVERVRRMSEQGEAYGPTRPLRHADPYVDPTQLGWSR